jgi:hypothetical protein
MLAKPTLKSAAACGLVIFLAACDVERSTPVSPPPAASRPPAPTPTGEYTLTDVTLSGVVFEETPNGRAGIADVDVYCEPCGAETHSSVRTDATGFYTFRGVWTNASNFPTRILFQKEGYEIPAGLPKPTPPNPSLPGWREVVVIGDTTFDVQLVRK